MAAIAGLLLAIGSLLFLTGFLAVVALCRKVALQQEAEVEAEVKALSLSLKFRVRPASGAVDARGEGSANSAR
jgi:hypothetical protein